MAFQFTDPVVGGTVLLRPAIRNPGYIPGSAGWTVNEDGTVEFNNGTFRGTVTASTFEGTDFEINASGAFYYKGSIALGNLIASSAPANGTDRVGNAYLAGQVGYEFVASEPAFYAVVSSANGVDIYRATAAGGPWTEQGGLFRIGTGNKGIQLFNANNTLDVTLLDALDAKGNGQLLCDGVVVVAANPATGAPETWHTMALLAGFTAGGFTPRYRLMPDNTVLLAGAVNLTANQVVNTSFFGMPLGYVPSVSSFYATQNTLSGYTLNSASVKAESGGALRIASAGSSGNSVTLDGIRFPLD